MPANSPMEMPTAEELQEAWQKAKAPEQLNTFQMLVYGKPKRGKTHFLSTLPRPLILDFDGGAGLLGNKQKFPSFDGRIVSVTEWRDVEMWYWILKTTKHGFLSVAWDTVSMAQELALREVLGSKAEKNSAKDPYKATMDDYGRTGRMLRTWLTMYRGLPLNVVFTAHERQDEAPDEEDGEGLAQWYVPELQTSIRGFLCGLVPTIGYAYRVSKDGKLSFRMAFDRPGTFAADRYGVLPQKMVNPTFAKIQKYYRGENGNGNSNSGA